MQQRLAFATTSRSGQMVDRSRAVHELRRTLDAAARVGDEHAGIGRDPERRRPCPGRLGLRVLVGPERCRATTAATARRLPAPVQRDIAGLVDIGGGRQIWATCRGQGSPTVVLISGRGNGAEEWSLILDPDDPAHQAPGDDVSAGLGKLEASDDAVLPSVARTTRVCAYDRPDIRFDGEVTTPRPQPHPVDLDVSDLHGLLTAIGEPGPYVLVSHSYGGLVSTLFARTYPDRSPVW